MLSILALETIYKTGVSVPGVDGFRTYEYFMIPYSVIQGVIGGFMGWYIANHLLERRRYKENIDMQIK